MIIEASVTIRGRGIGGRAGCSHCWHFETHIPDGIHIRYCCFCGEAKEEDPPIIAFDPSTTPKPHGKYADVDSRTLLGKKS